MSLVYLKAHGLVASVVFSLLLAGCEHVSPPQPGVSAAFSGPYEPPSIYAHHSFVWDAPPDVDLLSPVMVVSRAFFESVVILTNPKSEGKVYQGYRGASAGTQYPPEQDSMLASTDVRGADYFSVLSLTTTGEDTTVVVCWDQSGTAQRQADGTYTQGWEPHPEKVFLRKEQSKDGGVTAVRQEGSRAAPAGDVFGGWKATKFSSPITDGAAETWNSSAEYDQYSDICEKQHKHGPPIESISHWPVKVNPDDPRFTPKAPYPGWPEPGHA